MCPSLPPDPAAWRRQRRQSRPPRHRRLKHPWITTVLVLLAVLLGFGGLGSLLDHEKKPTSKTATVEGMATQPQPETRSPQATRSSPEPSAEPTVPIAAPPESPTPGVVVLRVIDGDTIELRGNGKIVPDGAVARVRLLAIDTPEHGACFADTATARTAELLPPGSSVRIERDIQLTDRYDRYLLYVWTEQNVFVNESLVRSGHAEATLYPPNDKHWSTISRAEEAARTADIGLWSACSDATATATTPNPTPEPPSPDPGKPPGLPDGPPAGASDVDCSDLPGPVWVGSDDPHRLDRDGDGIGCDTN